MAPPQTSSTISGLAAARLWAAARFPYLASGIFGAKVVAAPGIGTVAVDPGWRLWTTSQRQRAMWTTRRLAWRTVGSRPHGDQCEWSRTRTSPVRAGT